MRIRSFNGMKEDVFVLNIVLATVLYRLLELTSRGWAIISPTRDASNIHSTYCHNMYGATVPRTEHLGCETPYISF